jgi:hypothetical protein
MAKLRKKAEKLKIPLSFNKTLLAALETPPERRKPARGKG